MLSRRSFIKSGLASCSLIMVPAILKAVNVQAEIGLQLYTVRDEISKSLLGTLRKVANIGYNYLELANYSDGKFYDTDPDTFKKYISDLGMRIISSHVMIKEGEEEKVLQDHAELGVEYVVIPWLAQEQRKSMDDYLRLAERLNKIGEKAKQYDLKFGYHNHDFEFDSFDGEVAYDALVKNTDKENVIYQLDLYWVTKAGYKPEDYFNRYPGRFELWHIKDMEAGEDRSYTEVGEGIIPFSEIFQQQKTAGMKYFFVEHDNPSIPSLESVKISYTNLKGFL